MRRSRCFDRSPPALTTGSLQALRIATRDEMRADVFDYIERFYNPRRRHSKLDYLSPVEFEARAMLA
jgi:transposase InsO family protein